MERIVSVLGGTKGPGTGVLTVKPVSALAPSGLVSVLIPCCGMLEYTKLCVANQLVALASTSAAIGLVGPMSNYAAPPQLVETAPVISL